VLRGNEQSIADISAIQCCLVLPSPLRHINTASSTGQQRFYNVCRDVSSQRPWWWTAAAVVLTAGATAAAAAAVGGTKVYADSGSSTTQHSSSSMQQQMTSSISATHHSSGVATTPAGDTAGSTSLGSTAVSSVLPVFGGPVLDHLYSWYYQAEAWCGMLPEILEQLNMAACVWRPTLPAVYIPQHHQRGHHPPPTPYC
jgi:hypothetical protein